MADKNTTENKPETTQEQSLKESSLTAPHDRKNPTVPLKLDTGVQPLNDEETKEAMKELYIDSFTKRFPQAERRYADPPIDLQKFGLISFVPASGAKPDEKGIFGFAKLRGNFNTEDEAYERSDYIIRHVDSYHPIYTTYVGRPFPITVSSTYSKEVTQIDLKQEMTKAISEDVKRKREKEQKEIEEVKKREEELLEDVKREEEPTDDKYTTLRVKKAQLTWTYSEYTKKLKEMVGLIAKARREIEIMDEKHPHLREVYFKKYADARAAAGLPTDRDALEGSFMKYMAEDLNIPEVDEEYRKLFGETKKVE